jgi:hypothetical protein
MQDSQANTWSVKPEVSVTVAVAVTVVAVIVVAVTDTVAAPSALPPDYEAAKHVPSNNTMRRPHTGMCAAKCQRRLLTGVKPPCQHILASLSNTGQSENSRQASNKGKNQVRRLCRMLSCHNAPPPAQALTTAVLRSCVNRIRSCSRKNAGHSFCLACITQHFIRPQEPAVEQ